MSTSTAALNSSDFAVRRTNATRTDRKRWAGRVLTALPVLFLVFDSVIKLIQIQPVTESFIRLGYDVDISSLIGIIELICLALHLVPRTAVFGSVLLTGFLGGAVATHVRVGDPLFSHVLFPIYIAALLWAGLYLRDPRVRALLRARNH